MLSVIIVMSGCFGTGTTDGQNDSDDIIADSGSGESSITNIYQYNNTTVINNYYNNSTTIIDDSEEAINWLTQGGFLGWNSDLSLIHISEPTRPY